MERYKPHAYEEGEGQPSKRVDIRKKYEEREIAPEEGELLKTAEAQEAIARVREIVGRVNQELLFNLFREHYGKSGNDPDSLSLTDIKDVDIFYNPHVDFPGGHSIFGAPEMNAAVLDTCSDDFIVNVLIHEYLHEATSTPFATSHFATNQENIVSVRDEQMSGVRKFVGEFEMEVKTHLGNQPSTYKVNDEINEGITQLLADDIHAEYNLRIGTGNNTSERRNRTATEFSPVYHINQFNLRVYVALISINTDIPEDVVKDAITKAYFRNGDVAPEEIGMLLDEDLSEENERFRMLLKHRLDKTNFIDFAENAASHLPAEKKHWFLSRCDTLYKQLQHSVRGEGE